MNKLKRFAEMTTRHAEERSYARLYSNFDGIWIEGNTEGGATIKADDIEIRLSHDSTIRLSRVLNDWLAE